jgi:hypothetical protein
MAKLLKEFLNNYLKYYTPNSQFLEDDDYNDFMLNYEMFEPTFKRNKANIISKKSFIHFIKSNHRNYR